MGLKTFVMGGVHPPEQKISAAEAIRTLPLPKTIMVPVSQHLGAPAAVLVKRGDLVKTGQLLAKATGFISANIHSPATGKVAKIDVVMDQSGYKRTSIIIETTDDEWMDDIDTSTDLLREITLSKKEIIDRIHTMGVVGLGGATFPVYVKMMVPEGKKAELLLINGVECEPYLTADHRLMLERSDELMVGITILMQALGVEKAVIGIENNKPDAIQKLSALTKNIRALACRHSK